MDIDSFMRVTGPKTDVWLVKTVSVLLIPISLSFITHLVLRINTWPAAIMAITCCIGLACIDFYYALRDVISNIYMADGAVQLLLLAIWIYIVLFKKHELNPSTN